MKLNIIGNRGAFSLANQGTSCYLLEEGKTKICLDFGSSALSNVQKQVSIEQIDAIILTHLHFDHMADVPTLSYLLGLKKFNRKMDVYLPNDNSKVYNLLKGIPELNLIDIEENKEYVVKDLKFKFYEMKHKVQTYGLRVYSKNKVLSYTGDTVENNNILKLLDNADIALCDTCILDKNYKEGLPHISVLNMASDCKKANVKKMLLTHFTDNNEQDILDEAKKEFSNAYITNIGDEYII